MIALAPHILRGNQGIEHQVKGKSIVPVGGKLPYYLEVQTGKVLDLLREGIPTVRFEGKECFEQPENVVIEFLNMFLV